MPFDRIELWTIVAYIAVIAAVGVYFSRRIRGGTDYFAGGRRIPWWLSGVSLYMGNFSAWMFTGGAGLMYRTTGFGLLYFFLITTVAYVVGSRMTAALWRRSRVISPIEFTLARFGVSTQLLLAIIFAVMYLANAGSQLLALGRIVNGVLDIPTDTAVIAVGSIVMLYTLAGGVWTVVVTDFVQLVILLAVLVVVAPLAVGLVDGGMGAILAQVDFTIPPPDGDASHTLAFLVAGVFAYTLGAASVGSPRYYCVPDERDARRTGMLAGALFLTTPILFSVPALAGRALFGGPEAVAALGWGPHPHELVFLQVVERVLSPGLVGLFVAAMFAASMSALDSVTNVVAAVLSRDVWTRMRPAADERSILRTGRVMTLGCGLIVTTLAVLYFHGPADLFEIMTTVAFFSAPPLYVPMVLGMLYRRAPAGAGWVTAVWALACGFFTKVVLGWDTGPQVLTTLGTSTLLFLVSPGLIRRREKGPALDDLYARLDRPIDVATEAGGAEETARELLRLLGVLTLLMAGLVVAMFVFEVVTTGAPVGAYAGVVAVMLAVGIPCLLQSRTATPDAGGAG